MIVKQRAALIAAVCGALSMSYALQSVAADCVDGKGKHYSCKISNIHAAKPAPVPKPVLAQPAKPALMPAKPVLAQPTAPSLISNKPASGIVAQGAGNIVAQGAGNVVPRNGSGIVAQGAGNMQHR